MNPSYQLVLRSADIPNLDMSNVAVAKYTSSCQPNLLPWESRNLDPPPLPKSRSPDLALPFRSA